MNFSTEQDFIKTYGEWTIEEYVAKNTYSIKDNAGNSLYSGDHATIKNYIERESRRYKGYSSYTIFHGRDDAEYTKISRSTKNFEVYTKPNGESRSWLEIGVINEYQGRDGKRYVKWMRDELRYPHRDQRLWVVKKYFGEYVWWSIDVAPDYPLAIRVIAKGPVLQNERVDTNERTLWTPQDKVLSFVRFYEQGLSLYKDNRYEEAVVALDKAISFDPYDARAYHNKGFALIQLHKYEEALVALDETIRLDPHIMYVYRDRWFVLYQLKRYEDALADIDESIRLGFQSTKEYYNKGLTLLRLRRYEEALVALDEEIRLNPNHVLAYNNRGVALRLLQRYEEALIAFDEAIRLDPKDVFAYENKSYVLEKLGRYKEAREVQAKAEQLRLQS